MVDISCSLETMKSVNAGMVELRNYAKGLVDCGNDAGRVNAYSKTVLFNATLFNIAKFEDIYKLIKSIKDLIETVTYIMLLRSTFRMKG